MVHTNTTEGFWGLFKRGVIGIHHYVSPTHLDRYCAEFIFRYNSREISDAKDSTNLEHATEANGMILSRKRQ
jgi:hypothetical protein